VPIKCLLVLIVGSSPFPETLVGSGVAKAGACSNKVDKVDDEQQLLR
jgi:hypothetical protein